jgi:hypothetical protein
MQSFACLRFCVPLCVLAACSVPDKQSVDPDAGVPGGDGGVEGPTDSDAPETTIDQAPAMFSNAGQVTFLFSSNDPKATFSCLIDRELPQPCQSPYVRSLPDGSHSFSVRASDQAGNTDDTPAELVWTIDTVPPETSLVDAPPPVDNTVMPKFTFRSSEANVVFDCSLDNAAFSPCESGASFGPVGDDTHSFAVRARDRAGNIDSSPAIYPWRVDTSTPDTEITSGPADASASRSTTASFDFRSPDKGSNVTFQCSLDGAGFVACTAPHDVTGLGQGTHTFAVRVRDVAGNFDPSPADRSWTVDLTPPDTSILTGPTGAMASASTSVTFTSNELDATFKCSLDNATFASCTSPASLTGLAQGAHSFKVQATDAAGNVDASAATATWSVDTVAPDIAIVSGPGEAAIVGPRVVLGFTVSEGTVACTLDGATIAACASPIARNLPAGTHTLMVRSTDAAGNFAVATRTWTIACNAPDAAGAAGVLHLDDGGQSLANAVAGGASATLGDTADAEPSDPAEVAAGRFGGALAFTAAASDHVTWPVALPATNELSLELWADPASATGDLVVSGDGAVALRVAAVSATTVRFSISIGDATVSSAVVAANAWHHVLASLSPPTLRLWVDGVRTENAMVSPATPPALDALRLGGDGATAYQGSLDELWLAQTAITSDEPALARYCPL